MLRVQAQTKMLLVMCSAQHAAFMPDGEGNKGGKQHPGELVSGMHDAPHRVCRDAWDGHVAVSARGRFGRSRVG
jgi:hypothetical protein